MIPTGTKVKVLKFTGKSPVVDLIRSEGRDVIGEIGMIIGYIKDKAVVDLAPQAPLPFSFEISDDELEIMED